MIMNETTHNKNGTYRIGIYPGTFDPITKGHHDIIKRASSLVDHLIIGVADNAGKNPLFNIEERVALITHDIKNDLCTKSCPITVKAFDTLLIDFAHLENAHVVFRGLRAVTDFDYEFQMTGMNAQLAPDIETVFLMAKGRHQFVSSSFVKEIAKLNGDIAQFLSKNTLNELQNKLS